VPQSSPRNLLEPFADEQHLLVRGALPQVPWEGIRAYRPLTSPRWETEDSFSIERWTSSDESVLEISKRGEDQSHALKEIRSWVKAAEVRGGELSGGKTSWALGLLFSQDSKLGDDFSPDNDDD
jgi:hypothetical protein